jgi:hypothetical protein
MKPVLQLFAQIMALKGSRQVTVVTFYMGARTYDVSEEGVIGYAVSHRDVLLEHLEEAIDNEGGVVFRQFLAEKVLVRMPFGPRMVPIKHLFGVRTGRGGWIGLSSEDMRIANETDADTGKPLKPEEAVVYLDWSAGVAASSRDSDT